MKLKQDEVFSLENKENDLIYTKTKYRGFNLVVAYCDDTAKTIKYSYVCTNNNNVLMSTLDSGEGKIEVILVDDTHYLLRTSLKAIVLRIVDNKPLVLASVSADKPCKMAKVSDYLIDNNLIILTDYLPDERRNLQYLFNFKEGKIISSGYDSIDLVGDNLKASYGLADGYLDLEGNFILNGDEEEFKKPFFLFSLFKRETKSVGKFIR